MSGFGQGLGQGTTMTTTSDPAQTPAGGVLGNFDFNDIIALGIIWNKYRNNG